MFYLVGSQDILQETISYRETNVGVFGQGSRHPPQQDPQQAQSVAVVI